MDLINNKHNNANHIEFLDTFYETIHRYELAVNDKYDNNIIKYKNELELMVQSNLINASNQYGNIWDGFIRTYEDTLHKTKHTLINALNDFINNPHLNNKIKQDKDFIKYKLFFTNN